MYLGTTVWCAFFTILEVMYFEYEKNETLEWRYNKII